MNEVELGAKRCERIAALLSLDVMAPFYELMGLMVPLERRTRFVAFLRRTVAQARADFPSRQLPDSFAREMLDEIELQLGREVRDHYLNWVVYVFEECPADHLHTHAWSTILNWCAADAARWASIELPAKLAAKLRLDFRTSVDCQDIDHLVEQTRLEALSSWDADLFEQRRFGLDDVVWDPFPSVENTVFRYRFRHALQRIVDQLTEDESIAFWKSVTAIGVDNELTSLEELKHPGDLEEPA